MNDKVFVVYNMELDCVWAVFSTEEKAHLYVDDCVRKTRYRHFEIADFVIDERDEKRFTS